MIITKGFACNIRLISTIPTNIIETIFLDTFIHEIFTIFIKYASISFIADKTFNVTFNIIVCPLFNIGSVFASEI